MENASKALLIAAAVLVVIILVAVGMKIYSSTTGTQKVAADTGKTISDKTGKATDLATYEITGKRSVNPNIKYYEKETNSPKSQEDASLGDTIYIGEERFIIFSKTTTQIKAMPYYNLVTVTADGTVKQGPAVSGTSRYIQSAFSTSQYWSANTDAIDMSDSRNNIQQYITAYKTTLKGLGADVEVRAVRYSEIRAIVLHESGSIDMLNPGQKECYWTCSTSNEYSNYSEYVINIASNGGSAANYFATSNIFGVRPIIIIN